MHPAAWFAWTMGAGLVAAFTTNPFYLLPLIAGAALVHATHRRGGPHARSFAFFAAFAALTLATRTSFVLFQTVTMEATAFAFLEGLRLATLLVIFGTFNSVSDPFGVLRLAPQRFHEPALAAALALSITPRMIDAVGKVREAQRLRGMNVRRWRSLPALAVPVLATGMDEAVVLAESMDARGHGRGPRTRYRPDAWTNVSGAVVALSAIALGVFVWAARSNVGDLQVSTYPLRWPEADPLLVIAAFSVAIPALIVRRTG